MALWWCRGLAAELEGCKGQQGPLRAGREMGGSGNSKPRVLCAHTAPCMELRLYSSPQANGRLKPNEPVPPSPSVTIFLLGSASKHTEINRKTSRALLHQPCEARLLQLSVGGHRSISAWCFS